MVIEAEPLSRFSIIEDFTGSSLLNGRLEEVEVKIMVLAGRPAVDLWQCGSACRPLTSQCFRIRVRYINVVIHDNQSSTAIMNWIKQQ